MSTIGVGKAAREIDRAGRRSRERGEQRVERRRAQTRAADWEGERGIEAACTSCGHDDDIASMYTASSGLVCATCFSADEGEIVLDPVPTVWQLLTKPGLYSPLLLPVLLYGTTGLNLLQGTPLGWFGDVLFLAWLCGLGGSFGWIFFLGLSTTEAVRQTVRRQDLTVDERRQVVVGHLWHWGGLVGVVAASFAGATWLVNL